MTCCNPANWKKVRILSGEDIDSAGANLSEKSATIGRTFTQTVEPYTEQIITVSLL